METDWTDNFVVILFSNEQLDIFPSNRPSHFENRLAHPLKFGGGWKVALTDIHFMHNFDNFVKQVKIGVFVPSLRAEYSTLSRKRYAPNGDI
jgi:hypothetical protein